MSFNFPGMPPRVNDPLDVGTAIVISELRRTLSRDYDCRGKGVTIETVDDFRDDCRMFRIITDNGGLFIMKIDIWKLISRNEEGLREYGRTIARATAMLLGKPYVFRVFDNGEALIPEGAPNES